MIKSKKAGIIIVFVFLFCESGCVSDEANRYYLKEKLPPKNINDVAILRDKPQRPYTVIADFQAKNGTFLFFVTPVEPKHMQKLAAEVGADAVIIVYTGGWYSWDETRAGGESQSNSYTGMVGTAIKYKTD
ncbi:MAG: hypothetical protein JW947_07430 [Sedimentisphaerales bacterium]|nr:hypothetical protein [Sedimentisphaerales bacterium]